jgi:predicted dehydrogenase
MIAVINGLLKGFFEQDIVIVVIMPDFYLNNALLPFQEKKFDMFFSFSKKIVNFAIPKMKKNMKKLRTIVIGFGHIGKTHARNILMSETMTLTAVVDNRPDALSAVLEGNIKISGIDPETLAGIRLYPSPEDCLKAETVDLAYICVHTPAHYEMAMKLLQHGAHVFVEKPFVLDINEGVSLIEEAKRCRRLLGVAHVVRFMPSYIRLKELFAHRTYGELQFISLSRFSGTPGWGDWVKWRTRYGESGGALFDLLVHDIDFLHYMLGVPDTVESVCFPGVLSLYDYVCAFWRYKGHEWRVKVEGGNTFPSPFPFEASYKAVFEKATVTWSSSNRLELKVINDESVETVPLGDPHEGYLNEGLYFADCILHNREPVACSAESSLETIRICQKHIV